MLPIPLNLAPSGMSNVLSLRDISVQLIKSLSQHDGQISCRLPVVVVVGRWCRASAYSLRFLISSRGEDTSHKFRAINRPSCAFRGSGVNGGILIHCNPNRARVCVCVLLWPPGKSDNRAMRCMNALRPPTTSARHPTAHSSFTLFPSESSHIVAELDEPNCN